MWCPDQVQYKGFKIYAEAARSEGVIKGFRIEIPSSPLVGPMFFSTGDIDPVTGWQKAIKHAERVIDGW